MSKRAEELLEDYGRLVDFIDAKCSHLDKELQKAIIDGFTYDLANRPNDVRVFSLSEQIADETKEETSVTE